jgi:hypothetical protein
MSRIRGAAKISSSMSISEDPFRRSDERQGKAVQQKP